MTETSGFFKQHPRTCQKCGIVFVAVKATAKYCSNTCRMASSRYGRSYGHTPPRQFGWTRS